MRINDDGSIPKDNPFVNAAGALPEIFTIGHRNTLGLAVHPVTGAGGTGSTRLPLRVRILIARVLPSFNTC